MDNRPIGFLDSGVGGLTVVRQLFRQLPSEEVVYIGDTKRMPYGPRPAEEILAYTWEMVNFLMSKNVKMICFACNTATAIALDEIRNELGIPVIGVILPGASAAIQKTKTGHIGIIGTQATVNSDSYRKAVHFKSPDVEVISQTCSPFVPLVESGDFDNQSAYEIVKKELELFVGKVDTLILGCTHYPLLAQHIQKVMGPEVKLVDSGAETVRDISVLLNYFKLNRKAGLMSSNNQFYTTGSALHFKEIAEKWLGKEIDVETVNIESYSEKKILIATRNQGKVNEFRDMFTTLGYEIESLFDYPDLPDVEETGSTFEENARLKAETISKLTGEIVISDDSGLCVDLLGGLPGIWSHRFSGMDATDIKNNVKLLHELASTELTPKRRAAHFHCTLVAARPNHESLVVEADWQGRIANRIQGENGFGYDPLFLVGDSDKSAAEISQDEKNRISHRGQALKKLMQVFPDWAKD